MSTTLIEDYNKLGHGTLRGYSPVDFTWIKCCRTDNPNVYEAMQYEVSCKDYVLDTQFNSGPGFNKNLWTQEQIRNNTVVLNCRNTAQIETVTKHITEFLHPIEEGLGLRKTKVLPLEKPLGRNLRTLVLIDGDDRWNCNGFIWSLYLSTIRALAHFTGEKVTSFDNLFSNCTGCNEFNYYKLAKELAREFLHWSFENFPTLMEAIPAPYNEYTGYKTKLSFGHGSTGPFYLSNSIHSRKHMYVYKKYNKPIPEEADVLNYILAVFVKELEDVGKM